MGGLKFGNQRDLFGVGRLGPGVTQVSKAGNPGSSLSGGEGIHSTGLMGHMPIGKSPSPPSDTDGSSQLNLFGEPNG